MHDLMLILELFYRIMIKNEEEKCFCEMFVVSTFERVPTRECWLLQLIIY